jgi:hypothetical protein
MENDTTTTNKTANSFLANVNFLKCNIWFSFNLVKNFHGKKMFTGSLFDFTQLNTNYLDMKIITRGNRQVNDFWEGWKLINRGNF